MQMTVETLMNALSCLRLPAVVEEAAIHEAIARALTEHGIEYIHEAKLGPGCRIDFLCGSIGIEVKKGHPDSTRLKTQLARYLAFSSVSDMIVVLQKPCTLPASIGGKSVRTLALDRLWGVALP